MNRSLKILIFTLVLSCIAQSTMGQSAGSVTGYVTDLKMVVAGATVTLSMVSTPPTVRTTSTDNDGHFRFDNVPLGKYKLDVTSFVGKSPSKEIVVSSTQPTRIDFETRTEACADESGTKRLMTSDRAEVVRKLIEIELVRKQDGFGRVKGKFLIVPDNFDIRWLTPEQNLTITVLDREKIQQLAEKNDQQLYYSISKMSRVGNCVAVTLARNLAIQGQTEDANMAGGSVTYEFRKYGGVWSGTVFARWLS